MMIRGNLPDMFHAIRLEKLLRKVHVVRLLDSRTTGVKHTITWQMKQHYELGESQYAQ
jgi:hypothetical protein